ncbi:hypothetical protein BC937DRAFT_89535 [Endogone sp. FLAS-F59071]|nr:hypothetical protein BC937DRAFT_89535 [Endogone sp. FLAS-F59071]|eukprot:RUS22368.1 hypothetical protein BC937DRAFT_89535 [Endogone sp. FLAS-F59071]
MAFRPYGRPKDDDVLGDGRVDNIHCTHGPPRVVEHPLLLEVNMPRISGVEICDQIRDQGLCVVAVIRRNVFLRELLKDDGVEHVELVFDGVKIGEESKQPGKEDAANKEASEGEGGGGLLERIFGHGDG